MTISRANENGSVWIDGAEYSFTADVASINCESSCPDCTNPVLTALTDETICDGDNFTISNVTTSETTGLTVSYQWFNNNGTDNANTDLIASETTATLTALPTAVGAYSYRVVATNTADNTCTAEQTVNLIIDASPTLSIDGATCDAGDTTYTIDFTSDSTVTSTAGTVVGNQVIDIPAGTDVTLTATLNGCTAEETIISPDCGPNCPTTRCMKIILTKQN